MLLNQFNVTYCVISLSVNNKSYTKSKYKQYKLQKEASVNMKYTGAIYVDVQSSVIKSISGHILCNQSFCNQSFCKPFCRCIKGVCVCVRALPQQHQNTTVVTYRSQMRSPLKLARVADSEDFFNFGRHVYWYDMRQDLIYFKSPNCSLNMNPHICNPASCCDLFLS